MPRLDRKQMLIIGVGALALVLLYRWYSSRGGGAAPAQPMPDGTDAAAASQLAGQEQADVAGLGAQEQSDVGALQQVESGDVADLSGGLQSLAGQEASDVSGLNAAVGGLGDQLGGLQDQITAAGPSGSAIANLTKRINQIAAGQKKTSRQVAKLTKQKAAAKKAAGRKAAHGKHKAGGHATHPHGHQSPNKHAGSGAVAPSSHHPKPHVTAKPKTATHQTQHNSGAGRAIQAHPQRSPHPRRVR